MNRVAAFGGAAGLIRGRMIAVYVLLIVACGGMPSRAPAQNTDTPTARKQPAAITPERIRRQFVPVDQPAVWPRGEFVPWPAGEFQSWMSSGSSTTGTSPRLALTRQVYRARLDGGLWTQGQFVWSLSSEAGRGITLPGGLVAIAHPRQGDELVPCGVDAAGVFRLFPPPGLKTIKGDWEAGRLDPLGTAGWTVWRFPPALATQLELTLPARLRLAARGCEVTVSNGSDAGERVWSIEAGAAREVTVVVSPTDEVTAPPTLRYTAETAFSLRAESARFQCDLFITSSIDATRDVTLRIPAGIRVDGVSVRDLAIALPPALSNGSGTDSPAPAGASDRLVPIPVELLAGIPHGPIRVRGQVPAATDHLLRLTVPSVDGADFLDGGIVARAEPPYQMGDLEATGLRVTGISQRTGEGDLLTARQAQRHALLAVSAYTSDLLAEVDTWTLMRFEPQVTTAETVALWRAQSGSTFDLKCRLPAGWEVTDVRTDGDQQPGDVSRWRFDDATGTLRIDLLSPLTPGTPRRLRISARQPGDAATAPVVAPRLISPGVTGGVNWCVVVDSQFRGPAFAQVAEDGGRRTSLESTGVPTGWGDLSIGREPLRSGEQIVGAARLPGDGSPTEVRLSPPRRPIDVDARLSCREEAGVCNEELLLTLTPREQVVDRFTVAGFVPGTQWAWSIVSPRGLDLRVEPRPPLTEELGERYEVRLSEAVSSPVVLSATRTDSAAAPGELSLPFVEEIRAFRGRLLLATLDAEAQWKPQPVTGPEPSRSSTVESTGARTWDYSSGMPIGKWVRLEPTGTADAARFALDVRGRVQFGTAPGGGPTVELTLRGLPDGSYELPLRFPTGVDHVAVEGPALLEPVVPPRAAVPIASAVIPDAADSSEELSHEEYRLRGSPAGRDGPVVLRYTLPRVGPVGYGWARIDLPVFRVPVEHLAVETTLPPGWAYAAHVGVSVRNQGVSDTGGGWRQVASAILDDPSSWSVGQTASGAGAMPRVPEGALSVVWTGRDSGEPLLIPMYDRLWVFYASLLLGLITLSIGLLSRLGTAPRLSVRLAALLVAVAILMAGMGAPWSQVARWTVLGLAVAVLVPEHWLRVPRPSQTESTGSSPQGSTRSFATLPRGAATSGAMLSLVGLMLAVSGLAAQDAAGDLLDVLVPVDAAGQPAERVDENTALVYVPPPLVPVLEEFRRRQLDVPSVLVATTELRPIAVTDGRLSGLLTIEAFVRRGAGTSSLRLPARNLSLNPDEPCLVDGEPVNVLPLLERDEFVVELPLAAPVPAGDSEPARSYVPRRVELPLRIDPEEDGRFTFPLPRAALHRLAVSDDWTAARDLAGYDGIARSDVPVASRAVSGGTPRVALADVVAWRLRSGRMPVEGNSTAIGITAETIVAVRQEMTDVTIRAALELPPRYVPAPIGWRLPQGWRLVEARAGGRLLADRRGIDRDSETWWIVPAGASLGAVVNGADAESASTGDSAATKSTTFSIEMVCQAPGTLPVGPLSGAEAGSGNGASTRPTGAESGGGLILDRLEWLPEGTNARPLASPRLVIRSVGGIEPVVAGTGLESAVPLPLDAGAATSELRPVVAWRLPAAARLTVRSTVVSTPLAGVSRADLLFGADRSRVRFVAELDEYSGLAWRLAVSPGLKVVTASVLDGPVERLLRWSQQGEQVRLLLSEKPLRKPVITITAEFETRLASDPLVLPRWVWPGDKVAPTTVCLYHTPAVQIALADGLVPVDAPAPRAFSDAIVYGTFVEAGFATVLVVPAAPAGAGAPGAGHPASGATNGSVKPTAGNGKPAEPEVPESDRERSTAEATPVTPESGRGVTGELRRPLQALLQPAGARWAAAIVALVLCTVLPRSGAVRRVAGWIQQRTWRGASLLACGLWLLGWAATWSLVVALLLGVYGLLTDIAARYQRGPVLLSR